jgi:hypothetical protein
VKPRENRDGIIVRSRLLGKFPKSIDELKATAPTFRNHKYAAKVSGRKRRSN